MSQTTSTTMSKPRILEPHSFDAQSAQWLPATHDNTQKLTHSSTIKVISWNIFFDPKGLVSRTSTALNHLQQLFGTPPGPLVMMFQEITMEAMRVILDDLWIQRYFNITNIKLPESVGSWVAESDSTTILVSKDVPITRCFRVPFESDMGRDALVLDVRVTRDDESTAHEKCLRFCTAHLESYPGTTACRKAELEVVSALLKGENSMSSEIVGGVVGGDMNALSAAEHQMHKSSEIELNDAWEDIPAQTAPVQKGRKDESMGRSRGFTFGYQSMSETGAKLKTNGQRFDKFFYTGAVEMFALQELEDFSGKVGRIGVGLKTSDDIWVSDHFGIGIGVKVL